MRQRFTELYERHYPQVFAYAVSRAGRQLADDVVSEAFLIAWRRLGDVPVPALPWLLAVARNVALSQFRAADRQRSVAAEMGAWTSDLAVAAGAGDVTTDVAEQVTERLVMLTALASLPEADRELLTLLAWHGLTPGQAARVTGCSAATLFVRLHRARRRLQEAVGQAAAADRPRAGGPGRTRVPATSLSRPDSAATAPCPGAEVQ